MERIRFPYMIYDKDYLPVDSGKVADPADITIPADGYDYYVQLETASGDEKKSWPVPVFFQGGEGRTAAADSDYV